METIVAGKAECVCKVVRDAAREITNAYDKALAPSGLRTTQYTMLSVLARQSTASVTQLSELLGIDQTTTTRNLSVLEDSGLISRVPHHDPRVKLVKLTDKGKHKRQLAADRWEVMQDEITSNITKKEWKTFRSVLDKISNVCQQME
jgi:DNA-binding MarR family transcriptional regulator